MSDVALVVDYLPLPERHHHDRQVVDGGFAGAVAGALGVAEELGVVVAEADGDIPTPSSRSPSFAWGAVTAPASPASLASRAAGTPSWVRVATETTGAPSSAERSS